MYKCLSRLLVERPAWGRGVPVDRDHEAGFAVPHARRSRYAGATMRSSVRRAGLLIGLAAVGGLAAVPSVRALNGTASYAPAESNISGKYWVSATATSGDA